MSLATGRELTNHRLIGAPASRVEAPRFHVHHHDARMTPGRLVENRFRLLDFVAALPPGRGLHEDAAGEDLGPFAKRGGRGQTTKAGPGDQMPRSAAMAPSEK